MKTLLAKTEEDGQRWQQYVNTLPQPSHYHRWGWKHVIESAFGWRTYYLMVEDQGRTVGVLPLAWQKSRLFGSFLTSLPFLSGGGIAASNKAAEEALLNEAIALAQRLGARSIELRYRRDPGTILPTKTNKVAMVRKVEEDADKMFRELPHKVRTDVRKALKSDLSAEFQGEAALDEFYRIFALNMRNLGTPVYSRAFFRDMLRVFPDDCFICLVRHRGKPIAASFLMGHRGIMEAGWSSSLYEYTTLKPNMFLYWSVFCFAGQKGYHTFDFGRSTVGSGTHRFKLQWGAQELPLHWACWLPEGGRMSELNPQNPRYRLAIWLWQRLPVLLTTWIGPRIARCLP